MSKLSLLEIRRRLKKQKKEQQESQRRGLASIVQEGSEAFARDSRNFIKRTGGKYPPARTKKEEKAYEKARRKRILKK